MSEAKNTLKETLEEYNNNLKFDNMYNELEFYKNKCEVYEKDLFKSQTQLKKLELSIKKLQDKIALNSKNINNTSIPFLLPSEFKNNWESCVKDQIMEAFENIYDNYYWLSHIVQDSVTCIYEETKSQINEKILQVLKLLNIKDDDKENKFLPRFRTLFQEYFSSVFVFSDDNHRNINNKLKYEVISTYKNIDDEIKKKIILDLDSKFFKIFCQSVFKFSIYMLLHDPQLTLNIDPYNERKLKYIYYVKKEHLNIEGFETESNPCIIILNPPMLRKAFSYQGMKPAVYMIQKYTEDIKKECDKNINFSKKGFSNEYICSFKSDNIDKGGENSLLSARNSSSVQNRKTPDTTKLNNDSNPNLVLEKESPKIKSSHSFINKEKISSKNQINSIIMSDKQKTAINLNNIAPTIQDTEFKNCYDHPLSLSKAKKGNEASKETNLLTLNHINNNNINIANGVSLLSSNKHTSVTNENKNVLSSDKNIKCISQNIKYTSRNNSVRESSNNSLNKDSLKMSEKCDNLNYNLYPHNILHNSGNTSVTHNNINKVVKVPIPNPITETHKDTIVNNQELVTKNDKKVSFNQVIRKKNLENNQVKNNYILDNNIDNENIKNDMYFKVNETNKLNYPLKIEQSNHTNTSNTGGYYNNYISNQIDKNETDNISLQKEIILRNAEIGKSLLKFEKKRSSIKNNCPSNNSSNTDNLNSKNVDLLITKCGNFERNKNEKSPRLTSSNNSASNTSNNIPASVKPSSQMNHSNNRGDASIKSSVKHVLDYVNKGLSHMNTNKDHMGNNRTSLKSKINQDIINKGKTANINQWNQENYLIDTELNNALIFNNNINYLNKNKQEILTNDMKFNGPKKDSNFFLENEDNTQINERDKYREVLLERDSHTPKLEKFTSSKVSKISNNSPQIIEKNKYPSNVSLREKNKLFELNNNQIIPNNSNSNQNSTQNSSRIFKNQVSFQQQKAIKKN